jgi:hypothetical protein
MEDSPGRLLYSTLRRPAENDREVGFISSSEEEDEVEEEEVEVEKQDEVEEAVEEEEEPNVINDVNLNVAFRPSPEVADWLASVSTNSSAAQRPAVRTALFVEGQDTSLPPIQDESLTVENIPGDAEVRVGLEKVVDITIGAEEEVAVAGSQNLLRGSKMNGKFVITQHLMLIIYLSRYQCHLSLH